MHYILELSSDTNVIGSQYPQIQKMKPGYNLKSSHSVHVLSGYYHNLPEFIPDLDGFILHAHAKPTDFLSNVFSGPWGFIISENVKNILQNFNLPLHAFYPAKIYYRKEIFNNYYWLHVICDLTDIIDYPASTFFIYKGYAYDLGDIKIFSKEDLISKRKYLKDKNQGQNLTIWGKKLKLIKEINFDFFKIGEFDSNNYISADLYATFLKEKVNGIAVHHLPYSFY